MNDIWLTLSGIVIQGHRVASQKSEHYPRGTIEMQLPFFKQLGLDLSSFHLATLNVSIGSGVFSMKNPQHTFRCVRWTSRHPPEDFSFSLCHVIFKGKRYEGWIYYPHPQTKKRHWQDQSTIEIIAPYITGISYGDRVEIEVNAAEVLVTV